MTAKADNRISAIVGARELSHREHWSKPRWNLPSLTIRSHGIVTIWSQNSHSEIWEDSDDHKSYDHKSEMARSAGVEPTTLGFGNRYSIQLSYERVV